ncbi:MAG: RpiB/LacA/LacB family sugar-phosphate isomerase [Lachnospiraceae bacterium]|nr:RpiB/LacA/LacB family sugar-phosphate isomerase [Lachnospiraceae bacterium]
MRIALINENSQAGKNEMIYNTLKAVVEPLGHEVVNYGMYTADQENQLTYVMNGILTATLLNSGAADFVVTGCGTGEGAMLACNSFPGVLCGHIVTPLDGFLFRQVNDGNAIALPFAEGFGWGGEINLKYIFEKTFECEGGQGYPPERVVPEQRNKKILDGVKEITHNKLVDILPKLDPELIKGAFGGPHFKEYFFRDCKCEEIGKVVKELIGE